MRYTTVIDITEQAAVYRNKNCRLLYLHMALKCGYHAEDRDVIGASIRGLAADCGLSVAATRHALAVLEGAGLIKKEGTAWRVTKFVVQQLPPPRTQKTVAHGQQARGIAEQHDEQIREFQEKVNAAVRDMSIDELEAWLAELREGRSLLHRRISLKPTANNVAWLEKVIRDRR